MLDAGSELRVIVLAFVGFASSGDRLNDKKIDVGIRLKMDSSEFLIQCVPQSRLRGQVQLGQALDGFPSFR